MTNDRPVSPQRADDDAAEASLRPQTLAEFVGQKASREKPQNLHPGRARPE